MTKYLRNRKGIVDIIVITGIMVGFLITSFLYDFGVIKPPEKKAEKQEVSATLPSGDTVSAETK